MVRYPRRRAAGHSSPAASSAGLPVDWFDFMITAPRPCPRCQKPILRCGGPQVRPVPCPHCGALLQIDEGAFSLTQPAGGPRAARCQSLVSPAVPATPRSVPAADARSHRRLAVVAVIALCVVIAAGTRGVVWMLQACSPVSADGDQDLVAAQRPSAEPFPDESLSARPTEGRVETSPIESALPETSGKPVRGGDSAPVERSPSEPRSPLPPGAAVATAVDGDDVESILKSGRWEKRAGLGAGMAWQYLDGGIVKIYDGSEVDEAYRWEVMSRNEAERKIRIRYWKSADSAKEHREFVFRFSPSGETAEVENWLHKNGQIELRGESTEYRVR